MLTPGLDLPARHPHFVGRQAELHRLERAFEQVPILALEGRAGSGKTALALELARRRLEACPGRPWLWVKAREGASLEALQLELARHWRPAAAPVELPLRERLLWLARGLNSEAATLVLDDFHLLENGGAFLRIMREYLQDGHLLLTSRQALELRGAARTDCTVLRLEALEPAESRRLLRQLLDHHDLGGWLETAHFTALLDAGRGQPLVLKLLVSLLLQNRRATLEDIARFQDELYADLVTELEAQLQPDERRALRMLALFGRPVPATALGVGAKTLSLLCDHLLVERGPGATWTTHDVFGDVYGHTLEAREAADLHAACAEYCHTLIGDPVLAREAIHHLMKCGQQARALALLVERGTSLCQAAQYEFLLCLTGRLADCDEPEATALRILRAEVLALVGETREALRLFSDAQTCPDPQLAIRAMNSHCHLLLERGDLEEAQAIAGRAFHRLEGMSGRRPGRVKALNAILRAILDGGEARTPNGPWRTLAGTLPGVLSAPYRLTTLEGQQTLDKEELGRLRARYRQYDLVLDLPGQRAWERERGELPLLRRKVLARILVALLKAAGGEPLTQEELFRAVWEVDYEPESGGPQVRKNMSALRDLLEPDRNAPRYLLLREGAFARKGGYLWSPERSFCLIEAL